MDAKIKFVFPTYGGETKQSEKKINCNELSLILRLNRIWNRNLKDNSNTVYSLIKQFPDTFTDPNE